MRRIQKQKEPECLVVARRDLAKLRRDRAATRGDLAAASDDDAAPGGASPKDWDTLTPECKDLLRRALAAEQLGLCAYCMRRLDESKGSRDERPGTGGMRIEHWVARSEDATRTLDWSNLLGVCGGILEVGESAFEHICDKARGDRKLALNPAQREINVQLLYRYTAQGEIVSDDPRACRDIDALNLQAATLRAQRSEVWRRQGDALRRDDSLGVLRRMLHGARTPGADGRLPPFAGVVEYYATRKLRQRGVKT